MAVPDTAGVLAELRRWIEASWDPELSLLHWRERDHLVQLFSEPDAGSDLAGLTTRAEAVAGWWSWPGRRGGRPSVPPPRGRRAGRPGRKARWASWPAASSPGRR